MRQIFKDSPYQAADTTLVMCGDRWATHRDIDQWFRQVEPDLDRITLEMCAHERSLGNKLDQWQLDAELAAFNRTRARV